MSCCPACGMELSNRATSLGERFELVAESPPFTNTTKHTKERCLTVRLTAAEERAEDAERALTEVVHTEPARMGHILDLVESPGSHPVGAPNSIMRRAQELGKRAERLRAALEKVQWRVDVDEAPDDYGEAVDWWNECVNTARAALAADAPAEPETKWPDQRGCTSDVHGPGFCNCVFPNAAEDAERALAVEVGARNAIGANAEEWRKRAERFKVTLLEIVTFALDEAHYPLPYRGKFRDLIFSAALQLDTDLAACSIAK